jgi:hypothetical protein
MSPNSATEPCLLSGLVDTMGCPLPSPFSGFHTLDSSGPGSQLCGWDAGLAPLRQHLLHHRHVDPSTELAGDLSFHTHELVPARRMEPDGGFVA